MCFMPPKDEFNLKVDALFRSILFVFVAFIYRYVFTHILYLSLIRKYKKKQNIFVFI